MNNNLLERKYWNVVLIIYGCHVPLFFFVSGYLYNEEKYRDLVGAFPELRWLYIVVVVFISIVITGNVKFIKKKLKY